MVLLHILAGLCERYHWKLVVAHLNHQLRGPASLADERLVGRTARELNLPLIVSRADVRKFAARQNLSLEMAARELRHDFLARTAMRRKIGHVALAHHLDDQVELFFLRLFRGAGSQGLAGMKWSSPSPGNAAVSLVRPLLAFTKSELRAYAAHREISYREDVSNECVEIPRNRIRHELLPLLGKHCPGGVETKVATTMEILGEESDFVEAAARAWLSANLARINSGTGDKNGERKATTFPDCSPSDWRSAWTKVVYEALPVAVQRRCVHLQLIGKGIQPQYDLIEHLRLSPGKVIEIGTVAPSSRTQSKSCAAVHALRITRDSSGAIQVVPSQLHSPGRSTQRLLDFGTNNGSAEWEGVRFTWQVRSARGMRRVEARVGLEVFDADRVGRSIVLRHWKPGDRFQPSGMANSVKLQDLFVNQKVPKECRTQLIVGATAQGELFWVEGLRISEQFKLRSDSIRRLQWRWQRL